MHSAPIWKNGLQMVVGVRQSFGERSAGKVIKEKWAASGNGYSGDLGVYEINGRGMPPTGKEKIATLPGESGLANAEGVYPDKSLS